MSIRDDFFAAKAKGSLWDVAVSIKRGNPLPLDADSIFESYAALEAYAADVLAYPGQVVAVVNADSTGIYYLDQDLAIQPVGVVPAGDGLSVVMDDNDVISLHNYGKKFYKYIAEEGEVPAHYEPVEVSESNPWKAGLEPKVVTEGGKLVIGWYEPNPTTIEGVNDQVTAVQGTVADLEESVGVPSAEGQEATGLYKEVEDVQKDVEDLSNEVGNAEDTLGDDVNTLWAHVNSHDGRLDTIESDYLKASDKKELQDAIDAIEIPVLGVAAEDKVLSLGADKLIAATVGMSYDSENKKIILTGKEGVELGSVDATPFIKDGMLESVDYDADAKKLTFKWNTASGITEDTVELGDLIDTYTAGNGLVLTGSEFAIKLADGSEGFLTVDANGLKLAGVQEAINTAKGEAATDAQNKADAAQAAAIAAAATDATTKADAAKQAAIDDAAGKYATTGALSALEAAAATKAELSAHETAADGKYATKDELAPVATDAANAKTAVTNLETRFDEIVAVGGEPNAINKIQVNGKELTITDKTVNIPVPTTIAELSDWTAVDERITAAKNQADKGVTDAAAADAKAVENATAIQGHETRLATVEGHIGNAESGLLKDVADLKAHDNAHATEFNTLKGVVDEHSTTIAGWTTSKADTSALNSAVSRIAQNETDIKTLNETTIPGINTEINKKANAADVYTKTEVGTIAEGKTLVQMIEEAADGAEYDDTAVRGLIAGNTSAISAIYKAGEGEGAAATGILPSEIARVEGLVTAEADRAKGVEGNHEGRIAKMETFWAAADDPAGTIDKLAEIVAYIEADQSGALDMAADIQANTNAIAAIYKAGEGETPASGVLVDEIARVEGKADANTTAIAAINNETTGILAQAKGYADAQIAAIPAATAAVLGLVKYDDTTIKMNESNQLYVAEVSTDVLVNGSAELVLNGGKA